MIAVRLIIGLALLVLIQCQVQPVPVPGVLEFEQPTAVSLDGAATIETSILSSIQLGQIIGLKSYTTPSGGVITAVGDIKAGQWFQYSINVASPGTYSMRWSFASITDGKNAFVYINGILSTTIKFFSTASLDTFSVIQGNINIPMSGIMNLRIVSNGGVDFDDITFTKVLYSDGPSAPSIPIYNIPINLDVTSSYLKVSTLSICGSYKRVTHLLPYTYTGIPGSTSSCLRSHRQRK
jgi:hypothetical protein